MGKTRWRVDADASHNGTVRVKGAMTWLAVLLACASANAHAIAWVTDPSGGDLGFTASFENTPANGVFRKFEALVRFDPDRLGESRIDVTIAVPSADMGSDEINRAIRGPDWFDSEHFAVAEFHSAQLRKVGASAYIAAGTLRVKGIAKAIEVPIGWKPAGGAAIIFGEVSIARAAYGIGLGEWLSTKAIGADVKVKFSVRLRKGA
jgi:polyisoprenoid-binding protein YceI